MFTVIRSKLLCPRLAVTLAASWAGPWQGIGQANFRAGRRGVYSESQTPHVHTGNDRGRTPGTELGTLANPQHPKCARGVKGRGEARGTKGDRGEVHRRHTKKKKVAAWRHAIQHGKAVAVLARILLV